MVVVAVVAATAARLVRDLPATSDYHDAADEGTYLRQALAVRAGGLAAFRQLGRDFVASPDLHQFPPPSRIGYITAAALAVTIEPSLHALSMLSVVSFAALGLATFIWGRRVWGEPAAALATVLLMVSPLDAGMARRALMDGHLALSLGVALLAFISWLQSGRSRDFTWFAAAAVWAMLVKETAFLFMPFFLGAAAMLKWRGEGAMSTRHLVVIAALPLVAIVFLVAVLGGVDPATSVVRSLRAYSLVPGTYLATTGGGPWHEYLVDHVLISPVSLLFFAWCGTWMVSREFPRAATLVIGFFWWGLAVLSLLPKNPRYAMPLDLPLRLGAALMIVEIVARLPEGSRRWLWRAGAAAGVAVIVAVDLATYQRMFITGRMYDPVAYNLLVVEQMAPPEQAPATPMTTPDALLAQSTRAYNAKDFAASIRFAEAAIALNPDFAEAYNNIGAARCELHQWREAIVPLQRALILKPDYPLARNNLAWAMSSLK